MILITQLKLAPISKAQKPQIITLKVLQTPQTQNQNQNQKNNQKQKQNQKKQINQAAEILITSSSKNSTKEWLNYGTKNEQISKKHNNYSGKKLVRKTVIFTHHVTYIALRSQKESFKSQQNELEDAHISKINEISQQYQDQINAKNSTIQSLERSLLHIKEDRNNKIENDHELQQKIKELESEKYQILKEKSQISLDKHKQIESIRNEFDLERKDWEKERGILTKNYERESFLENENVEYTNALARIQSTLQQKELENARLKGELNWIKQDKEEQDKTNMILKEENLSSQQQIDSLNKVISDKNKEMIACKQEHSDIAHSLQSKINKLQTEIEGLTERLSENQSKEKQNDFASESLKMNERIRSLTNALLEKQTEIDMITSKKNEYRIKLSKMEDLKLSKENAEAQLIKRSIAPLSRRNKSASELGKRNFSSYKPLNYGLSAIDRMGLELGRVMRNKPWLRVLIVFYIIVLHLWCFIVLHFSMNFGEDDTH